jgi:cytochrome P450
MEEGTMTEIATTPQDVPVITADPFLPENLMQPHALHEQLREAGPVVYLERYHIWAMARYEQVNAALKDWETFSSASGAGLSNFRK